MRVDEMAKEYGWKVVAYAEDNFRISLIEKDILSVLDDEIMLKLVLADLIDEDYVYYELSDLFTEVVCDIVDKDDEAYDDFVSYTVEEMLRTDDIRDDLVQVFIELIKKEYIVEW